MRAAPSWSKGSVSRRRDSEASLDHVHGGQLTSRERESRRGDSNPWPALYKSAALPAELLRRTGCTLSANEVRVEPRRGSRPLPRRDRLLEAPVPIGADDVLVVGDLGL